MIKTISATSINTYNECPKKWQYKYIYKLLEPENPAFIIGSAYHKALELYHTTNTNIEDELKKLLMPNKTKEEIDRYAVVRKMFDLYKSNPVDGDTLKTEYHFSLPLDIGVNLIGYIDRVIPHSIIDYKTSSFDYTESDILDNIQTDIYSYVIWKEKGELPNVVYHITNKKKIDDKNYKPQIITVKKTIEDMKELENKFKEFYKNITEKKFEPKQGNYCYWCPFRDYCK